MAANGQMPCAPRLCLSMLYLIHWALSHLFVYWQTSPNWENQYHLTQLSREFCIKLCPYFYQTIVWVSTWDLFLWEKSSFVFRKGEFRVWPLVFPSDVGFKWTKMKWHTWVQGFKSVNPTPAGISTMRGTKDIEEINNTWKRQNLFCLLLYLWFDCVP